jgi:hypothetical protein
MTAITNGYNPASIKSVMFVQNSAKHAEVVYVGFDKWQLFDTQLSAYTYAMKLKYNPIPAPNDNSSNPLGQGYYAVIERFDLDRFTAGNGTVYAPLKVKDMLTGLEINNYAVPYYDNSVKVGSTVYVTATTVTNPNNGTVYKVVAASTPRAIDLTYANLNSIRNSGNESTVASNAYYFDGASGYAYIRTLDGVAHYSYGEYVPYIELSYSTSTGTYTKTTTYESAPGWTGRGFNRSGEDNWADRRTKVYSATPTLALEYDLVHVRHLTSSGKLWTGTSNDWDATRVVTTAGTVYAVPYDTNGGFAIIVINTVS